MINYTKKIQATFATGVLVLIICCANYTYRDQSKDCEINIIQPVESDCIIVSASDDQPVSSSSLITSPRFIGSWPRPAKTFTSICKRPEDAVIAVNECKEKGFDEIRISCNNNQRIYDAIIRTPLTLAGCAPAPTGPLEHS
jgi:hypothetical protein